MRELEASFNDKVLSLVIQELTKFNKHEIERELTDAEKSVKPFK
jgi:hypothetical protein